MTDSETVSRMVLWPREKGAILRMIREVSRTFKLAYCSTVGFNESTK